MTSAGLLLLSDAEASSRGRPFLNLPHERDHAVATGTTEKVHAFDRDEAFPQVLDDRREGNFLGRRSPQLAQHPIGLTCELRIRLLAQFPELFTSASFDHVSTRSAAKTSLVHLQPDPVFSHSKSSRALGESGAHGLLHRQRANLLKRHHGTRRLRVRS
jgi:hypothetical protein